jgi:hypothetical protein
MKKTILLLSLTLTLYAGIDGKKKIDTRIYDKIPLNQLLSTLANKMAKSLPMVMDKVTMLRTTYAFNKTFTYAKEVDLEADKEVKEAFSNNLINIKMLGYENDSNTVCSNELLLYLLKRNAIIEYVWTDSKLNPLFDYTVELKDCIEKKKH